MSTLKVTNIAGLTGSSTDVMGGLAKAWVNFNGGGTIAARDSLNIGSLTDNGTGDYTIGYTSNMGNANYNSSCTGSWNDNLARSSFFGFGGNTANMTTSSIRTHCLAPSTYGAFDGTILCLDAKGDLA